MKSRHIFAWSFAIAISVCCSAAAQRNTIPWYERGAFLHFAASAELATNGYTLGAAFSNDTRVRLVSGAALALTAGFAKELYDLADHDDFSWRDIGWGAVGTASGLLVSWLVDRYLFTPRSAASAKTACRATTLLPRFALVIGAPPQPRIGLGRLSPLEL